MSLVSNKNVRFAKHKGFMNTRRVLNNRLMRTAATAVQLSMASDWLKDGETRIFLTGTPAVANRFKWIFGHGPDLSVFRRLKNYLNQAHLKLLRGLGYYRQSVVCRIQYCRKGLGVQCHDQVWQKVFRISRRRSFRCRLRKACLASSMVSPTIISMCLHFCGSMPSDSGVPIRQTCSPVGASQPITFHSICNCLIGATTWVDSASAFATRSYDPAGSIFQ
jgi:hypothetical protein